MIAATVLFSLTVYAADLPACKTCAEMETTAKAWIPGLAKPKRNELIRKTYELTLKSKEDKAPAVQKARIKALIAMLAKVYELDLDPLHHNFLALKNELADPTALGIYQSEIDKQPKAIAEKLRAGVEIIQNYDPESDEPEAKDDGDGAY